MRFVPDTVAAVAWGLLACLGASPYCGAEGPDHETLDEIRLVESQPDKEGLRRDTWYFLGYQAASIVILYAMPEDVTGWTPEQKAGYSMSIWWDNATHPQIDSDDFYLNYILHPYWGGAYYVRARERGYDDRKAFWYAALMSGAYEFGVEALFEEPSIQDIIVTPVGGMFVGRYFMGVRDNIRHRDAERGFRSRGDKWLWVLTDPLGALNRQVDRWIGRDAELRFRPYRRTPVYDPLTGGRPIRVDKERVIGLEFELRW